MDIHLRVTLTMVTAVVAGQITTYFSLLVFPTVWDLFDNKVPECDASSIVIMRVSGSKTSAGDCGGRGARGCGSRGVGGADDPQQASCADPPDRAGPARPAVCTCFGFVDCPDDADDANTANKGPCPKCNRQRRPRSRRALGTAAKKTVVRQPVEPQCKSGDVETYQVFAAPPPVQYNSRRHWNTIASFVLNAGLVVVLQCVKRSSLKLNTMWSAVFVSVTLALLYTLLSSNNREWRTRSFTTAFLVTLHKFIILLSMASVLTYNTVIDPLL